MRKLPRRIQPSVPLWRAAAPGRPGTFRSPVGMLLLLLTLALGVPAGELAALEAEMPVPGEIGGRAVVFLPVRGHEVPAVDGRFVVLFRDPEEIGPALEGEPFREFLERGELELVPLVEGLPGLHPFLVELPRGLDMLAVLAKILENPHVAGADPDVLAFLDWSPNDPLFGDQWALENQGGTYPGCSGSCTFAADIHAMAAWNNQDYQDAGASVQVFVLDTGIAMTQGTGQLSHPDLDDTSRIDPLFNVVYHTAAGCFLNDATPRDWIGHGTHVAGIIGAQTNNGTGIAGVCPKCKLKIVKTFCWGQGTLSGQYTAVGLALLHAYFQKTPVVINMSWHLSEGYEQVGSSTFEDNIAFPGKQGLTNVLFVAAAGNGNTAVNYPAAYASKYPEMIAVSRTDCNDQYVANKAHGPQVTVAAPGEEILSTLPNYAFLVPGGRVYKQNYDAMSGSSMATPHVAGLAGLLWTALPGATAKEIREYIILGAVQVGQSSYLYTYDPWIQMFLPRNDNMGYGRINACGSFVAAGLAPWWDCLRIMPLPPFPWPLP